MIIEKSLTTLIVFLPNPSKMPFLLVNKCLFWQNRDKKYGAIIFYRSIFLRIYGTQQVSILRSHLPITPINNEWLSRIHVWLFGEIGVEQWFGQKNSLLGYGNFSSKWWQKNHRIRDLEEIWRRFGTSKYLVIWTFEQIDKLWQAPSSMVIITPVQIFTHR